MADLDKREQFLIAMYNQLMNDINRHIVVVWQSIATLVAAIAAFSFVKDGVFSLDVAASIVLIACVWLLAHVYDASYWYNRNLVMIANIERQFLRDGDQREIHYYFGEHRPNNVMISHLRIQRALGLAVGGLVLATHFGLVIFPTMCKGAGFSYAHLMPWIIAAAGGIICMKTAQSNGKKYAEFLKNSPGREVDTSGIDFGIGHGFESVTKD